MSKKILSPIYICDYLNIFSDFREIKYKKLNIDFHTVKHMNKERDTYEFFELFFKKYIKYINININSNFIFVMKKLTNYENVIYKILHLYNNVNLRFIIIESQYTKSILDKNKDDFLCQYIISYLIGHNDNCSLISNDKYRDRDIYVKEFKSNTFNTFVKIMKKKAGSVNLIENIGLELDIDDVICDAILKQKYNRCTIPKNKLVDVL